MHTNEIVTVLKRDHRVRPFFRGVYARDRLPRGIIVTPAVYVVNTDASSGPGEHWVCVWIDSFKKCTYFDSFGFPPRHATIARFITRNSVSCQYNNRMLQHPLSYVCGLYVIYFVKKKSRGFGLLAILRPFHPLRQEANDRLVRTMLTHI